MGLPGGCLFVGNLFEVLLLLNNDAWVSCVIPAPLENVSQSSLQIPLLPGDSRCIDVLRFW